MIRNPDVSSAKGSESSPLKTGKKMQQKYIEIDQLREMKFDELREAGFINYVVDRNNAIKAKHAANKRNGLSTPESIKRLAEEYFLSEGNIHTIICRPLKKGVK